MPVDSYAESGLAMQVWVTGTEMYMVPNMQSGVCSKLRESHVVFVCKAVKRQRLSLGLAHYRNASEQADTRSTQSIMHQYIGGERSYKNDLAGQG